jgi:branched-chain amino acid transport system substrate-binding protein
MQAGKSLADKPVFLRTMADPSTPKQKKLYDRIGSKFAAPSAFPFAVHGYDATLLVAQQYAKQVVQMVRKCEKH